MSDNPLTGGASPNLNALQTEQANAPTPPAPPPQQPQPFPMAHMVSGATRSMTQDRAIARRDEIGPELEILQKVMTSKEPDPTEIKDYVLSAMQKGNMSGPDGKKLLNSIPDDPEMLQGWAKHMSGFLLHLGTHLHAAYPASVFPSQPQQDDSQQEQPS